MATALPKKWNLGRPVQSSSAPLVWLYRLSVLLVWILLFALLMSLFLYALSWALGSKSPLGFLGQAQAMSVGSAALVGDVQAGERKSVSCQACHGPQGISANPIWPNLAGQQEVYLANTLKAYRSSQRQDPLMSPMAAALTDQDIADLAAYYASLKP